ncbi:response regulator transcription factor [Nibrella saemangeumensis]|uniref:Response regulator transcription factor n=1 Tax=Nibrella saemangeumensis TaxID=1084526 RepID=A0ABP8MPU4_9BACT
MAWEGNAINIVIADDHQLFNDGLKKLLTYEGSPYQVVDQVYTGPEVVPAIHKHRPEIVLLDINLPGRNGIDIARQLAKEYPAVRIIIISMYSYEKFANELKQIGVPGYLLKSASNKQLSLCLQRVMEGKTYFDADLDGHVELLYKDDDFIKRYNLSRREIEIIKLIKLGLPASVIAEKLFLSEETVKTHRKNIYYKLNINSVAQLIQFANDLGL